MNDDHRDQCDPQTTSAHAEVPGAGHQFVTIRDAIWLGLCFGIGLGLALIFYGFIALAVFKVFITKEWW